MVESWAAALSKHAAQSHGARMSTGVLFARGRIAPLCPHAGVRRMLRRSVHADRTNKAWLGTRRGSMRFHADLHVHSKYSRATSRDLDLDHLAAWACRKGIGVVGTGDFTHPAWGPGL